MSVILRKRKLKKNVVSLYLDINNNGRRYTEFLKIKLLPKDINKKLKMEMAETIRANKEIELYSAENGIKTKSMKNIDFFEFAENHILNYNNKRAVEYFKIFLNEIYNTETISIQRIDKKMILDYLSFLHERLSHNTVHLYFNMIKKFLNVAIKEDIILKNPCKYIKSKFINEKQKVFLSHEEISKLVKTDCPRNDDVKKAFLFACYTGLRHSDLLRLRYTDIKNGMIQMNQKKTKENVYIPIHKSLHNLITDLNNTDDQEKRLFNISKYNNDNNLILKNWVNKSGIKKHVTFHSARHTFAVLMLAENVNIYTVSKLLGHTDIKTTEVYAKIVDETKVNAINTLPQINF
ncbi:MAG: site-specific integrase [Ignavibacteriales bacterium]|nr:site-specific integrase [Ignavibacteriales bacterium]